MRASASPIPSANFTATLLPQNAGEHDFVLTSRTELAFPGHYLSSVDSERDALTVLKLLYVQERIFVYVAEGELKTDHSFFLAGQRLPHPPLRDRTPRRPRAPDTTTQRSSRSAAGARTSTRAHPAEARPQAPTGHRWSRRTTMPSAKPSTAPTAMVAHEAHVRECMFAAWARRPWPTGCWFEGAGWARPQGLRGSRSLWLIATGPALLTGHRGPPRRSA